MVNRSDGMSKLLYYLIVWFSCFLGQILLQYYKTHTFIKHRNIIKEKHTINETLSFYEIFGIAPIANHQVTPSDYRYSNSRSPLVSSGRAFKPHANFVSVFLFVFLNIYLKSIKFNFSVFSFPFGWIIWVCVFEVGGTCVTCHYVVVHKFSSDYLNQFMTINQSYWQ